MNSKKRQYWDTKNPNLYQLSIKSVNLKNVGRNRSLKWFSPWILVDFRQLRRMLPKIQDGYNRKRLISEDGKKKKTFFVLKNFYDTKSASN